MGSGRMPRRREGNLLQGNMSDMSKIFYLEVIDATFSIDGVIGAFAFTMSVPLILIGNGIGAFIVRELTIRNVDNIKKYQYLKNGAMYSVFLLGIIMLLDSFGFHIPILGFTGHYVRRGGILYVQVDAVYASRITRISESDRYRTSWLPGLEP